MQAGTKKKISILRKKKKAKYSLKFQNQPAKNYLSANQE